MYCRRCYAALAGCESRCGNCGRRFDPDKPQTFLNRPFPRPGMIITQIIGTTIVGIIFAYVVAFFQMARTSGH